MFWCKVTTQSRTKAGSSIPLNSDTPPTRRRCWQCRICLRAWRVYLVGASFIVHIDNVANTFFAMQLKLSTRQERWQKTLAEYDLKWQHKPGWANVVPNALSRLAVIVVCGATMVVDGNLMAKVEAASAADAQY